MRKHLIWGIVMIAMAVFAFNAPAADIQPPRFGVYAFESLEDVELEGTFKGIATFDGRLFLILETDGKESYVLAPVVILRSINFQIRAGETLKISGKEIVWGDKTFVAPFKVVYKDKEYDISMFYGPKGRMWDMDMDLDEWIPGPKTMRVPPMIPYHHYYDPYHHYYGPKGWGFDEWEDWRNAPRRPYYHPFNRTPPRKHLYPRNGWNW